MSCSVLFCQFLLSIIALKVKNKNILLKKVLYKNFVTEIKVKKILIEEYLIGKKKYIR